MAVNNCCADVAGPSRRDSVDGDEEVQPECDELVREAALRRRARSSALDHCDLIGEAYWVVYTFTEVGVQVYVE